MNMIIGLL